MKKLLKIRFVKFERALVAQQLEIQWGTASFEWFKHTKFEAFHIDFAYDCVWLGRYPNGNVAVRNFDSNAARDEYLNKVVKWISEEQFATKGKLEIGRECEVCDYPDLENGRWEKRKLLAILPAQMKYRYITESTDSCRDFWYWTYARPIDSCIQPKIDGDVYTWEMEVGE